jgi:flagellar hook assembly protein FlgD
MLKNKLALMIMMVLFGIGLFASNVDALNDITINPNPMDKSTTITITFMQNVRADITIQTEDGTLVKTLFTGELNPGSYEFFWNRLSDAGVYVAAGKYYLTINYESRYTSTKKTLILK